MTMIVDWLEYKIINGAIEGLVNNVETTPKIKEILRYISKIRGKRTRPIVALISGKLCGGSHSDVMNFALAVELIHAASLVHDDVIDKGVTRRNVKTLHSKYGVPLAILTGDWLISKAVELVSEYEENIIRDFARLGMKMVEGEALDIFSLPDNADKKDYFECISAKTAGIFAFSAENACKIVSDNMKEAKSLFEYGMNLGIAYQLVDDLLEFLASYHDKKSELESRTLPIIYEEMYGFEKSVVKVLELIGKHASMSKEAIEYFEPCDNRDKLSKMTDYMTEYLLRHYGSKNQQFLQLIEYSYRTEEMLPVY
jgi:octaprenyl-diphosphate synthase